MGSRQIGQGPSKRRAHSTQAAWCPHGMKAESVVRSMQMLHVSSPVSRGRLRCRRQKACRGSPLCGSREGSGSGHPRRVRVREGRDIIPPRAPAPGAVGPTQQSTSDRVVTRGTAAVFAAGLLWLEASEPGSWGAALFGFLVSGLPTRCFPCQLQL